MFITIEEESRITMLVIRPNLFEKQRSIVLSSGMMAVHGRIQREGAHLLAHRSEELCNEMENIGDRYIAQQASRARECQNLVRAGASTEAVESSNLKFSPMTSQAIDD